ncbi:MAG TPA: hypothetical protein VF622_15465 [Segetibacter sp.]
MKKIAITCLAFTLVLAVSAQEQVKPPVKPKFSKAAIPPDAPEVPHALPAPAIATLDKVNELLPTLDAPSTPPVPPVEKIGEVPPAPDAPPPPFDGGIPEDYKAFLKRNPTVRSLGWTEESVIVRLKTGKKERYILTDEKSIKEAETKYGELPEAPPPPPPLPAKSKRLKS